MDKLLLVDGSNLLFQMFFGMPARITGANGRPIQGTLGFIGALRKIIRMTNPTHVLVIFDGEHENARREEDADYKASRPDYSLAGEEDNPFSQLIDICRALDYMNIRYTETTDCEADDLIAAYALCCGKEMDVVISSFDSDFFQLIEDRVSVLRYRGEKTVVCTPEYIMEKFGVRPEQYADWKSLVGDHADNIRGIHKIGPKTAAALLKEYGDLEGILSHAQAIGKASVREAILSGEERARLNRRLIRLSGGHALPCEVGELIYGDGGLTTGEVLKGIGLK